MKRIREDSFRDSQDLIDYLKERALKHNWHKYYSKSQYVESILGTHSVYLSSGENWNDKTDRDFFINNSSGYTNYGLCLSFSKSENISMWMLYSGNDGLMIDYDRATIKSIIEATKIELGFFNGDSFETVKTLYGRSEEFDINYADIVYYGDGESSGTYYIKRSDESKDNFSAEIIDRINIFKKKTAWSYENETRIVVSVKNELVDETIEAVKIEFPKEYTEKLKKRTYDSPNAKTNKYEDSKFRDKLNWDLCKDCKDKCLLNGCSERILRRQGNENI